MRFARTLLATALCAAVTFAVPAPARAKGDIPLPPAPVTVTEVRSGEFNPKTPIRDLGDGKGTWVLGVRAKELADKDLPEILTGRGTDTATVVAGEADPAPDETVGGVAQRMKIPGQRIVVIRGEILVDGVSTPVLIIIILGW